MNSRQRIGGMQHMLDYLRRMQAESPTFFYAVQGDDECSSENIFWADATARMNYHYFGDSIKLDTSYRANCGRVPFASFTGLNHHAQPVLFGCALLLNESETSLVWLLQTWLQAMCTGQKPVSITTEPDHSIQMAVTHVLPETRHRLCKWSILRETKEKLTQHLYQTHPTFETQLVKCINETETIEEFESQWKSLLERYFLLDNDHLQSIYSCRHQWVPVFLRETFFGEFSSDEDINTSFFDGFVDASTPIQLLNKQYEKAIIIWHEKELKADLDTTYTTPVLKTPSPMEKQAANLYTKKVFIKFQEELVETLANPAIKIDDTGTTTTYRVAKFGEEHKAHMVRFNAFELKADCTCLMFESSGIICRHALSVFRAKNVLTLPSQYILKRWTRNVKTGGGCTTEDRPLELPSNSQESLSMRHNRLRQEAIKFIEEGAKSIHSYNVAMNALKEAAKKVAAAKKNNSDDTKAIDMVNGGIQGMDEGNIHQADSGQSTEEKKQKIIELSSELEFINQRSEGYRANLLAVLKDMEEQKLKLSVKVQNARLSLKE